MKAIIFVGMAAVMIALSGAGAAMADVMWFAGNDPGRNCRCVRGASLPNCVRDATARDESCRSPRLARAPAYGPAQRPRHVCLEDPGPGCGPADLSQPRRSHAWRLGRRVTAVCECLRSRLIRSIPASTSGKRSRCRIRKMI